MIKTKSKREVNINPVQSDQKSVKTTEAPEPIYEAFAVIQSEQGGNLWHAVTLTIKGKEILKADYAPATLKYIAAERIREIIDRPRI